MKRLDKAPSGALRGDLVTETPMLPIATIIAPQLLHWSLHLAGMDELEYSTRTRLPRVIVENLAIVKSIQEARLSAGAFPEFIRPSLPRLQVLGGSAVAASLLLREQQAARDYLEQAQTTSSAEAIMISTDLGEQIRWHVKPGYENRLIDDYTPAGLDDEWLQFDRYYLHLEHPAESSTEFRESYESFYSEPFDPAKFVSITPVINRTLLEVV